MNSEIPSIYKQNLQPYIDSGYIFDDQRFLHLNRWTDILMQIVDSKNFLDLAEEHRFPVGTTDLTKHCMVQAFYRSFIITYAKCFASSGKGKLRLDKAKVFDKTDELNMHNKIMEIRHTYVAHNDSSNMNKAVFATKELDDRVLIAHTYTLVYPFGDLPLYRQTVESLETFVVSKLNKALSSIQEKIGKPVSFE